MRSVTIRPLGLALLATLLLIAACGGPAGEPSPPSVVLDGETVEMVAWRVGSDTLDCTGIPIAAADAVDVRFAVGTTSRGDDVVVVRPATGWNGDLVVFAHGYRDPAAAAGFWGDLPESMAELATALAAGDAAGGTAAILPLVVCPLSELSAPGVGKPSVAFAASSYSANGYALDVAPFETRAAAAWFDELLAPASRRFLIGASLGGAVTVAVAEEHPGAFDAGIPMCGPVGGTLLQIDYVGHAELAFRTLYPDAFDGGTAPTDLDTPVDELAGLPFEGGPDSVVGRIAAALAPGGAVDETLGGYTVQEAGSGEPRPLIPYDPADPDTLIDSFVEVFYFATTGKRDLLARTGGIPFGNAGVVYRDGGGSEVTLASIAADPAARLAAATLFAPSGSPGLPLHLIHNRWDPVVPSFHSVAYGDLAGLGPDLVVEIVDDDSVFADEDLLGEFASGAYGHCRFPGETLRAFNALAQP
jgi:hypothetical protein